MSGRQRVFVVAICLLSGVMAVLALRPQAPQQLGQKQAQRRADKARSNELDRQRPSRGLRTPAMVHKNSPAGELVPAVPENIAKAAALVGQTPLVPKDANPMVRSVVEAIETQKYPERLYSLILPKPFNGNAYKADPQAYLNIVEPGRVFQPSQPGPGVPRLTMLSPSYVEVPQKETISLKVKAMPNAPVTFTSFDLGAFQNQLTSITVAADADGVAVARFTGTPGTFNNVNILAASPTSSGNLKFRVNVIVPGLNDPKSVATK